MAKKSIRDIDLSGKRCLVRVDFNVPLDEKDGAMVITDATRIEETLPTLKYLIEKGAKVILCSHLGRPKGQIDPKQSLRPVAGALSTLLGVPVAFSETSTGPEAEAMAKALPDAGCSCWKTCVSMLERKRTMWNCPSSSPRWPRFL